METIFAPATARGKAGLAVIRISGPKAHEAANKLCGSLPLPRQLGLREVRSSENVILDEGLVAVFEAGASFTGEDVAELHLHGSNAVINAVLGELSRIDGLRLAEPGEFTRRAMESGKLDLAQVEGLADLIDSETEEQRRQAIRVLSGEIGRKAENWRGRLLRAAALVEASIDFADEELPESIIADARSELDFVIAALQKEISGFHASERIREGFEVAIIGRPNVGKSTLLNCLVGREAAIASEHAGTTRDVIEVRMDLGGLAVTFLDTAGMRETDDAIERIGVARAIQRAECADLRIFLVEAQDPPEEISRKPDDIVAIAKADIHVSGELGVSGKTGAGIGELLRRVSATLSHRAGSGSIITRQRHRNALDKGLAALLEGRQLLTEDGGLELSAETIRGALRALDSLVGRIDVEDVLGEIFSSFCIGK